MTSQNAIKFNIGEFSTPGRQSDLTQPLNSSSNNLSRQAILNLANPDLSSMVSLDLDLSHQAEAVQPTENAQSFHFSQPIQSHNLVMTDMMATAPSTDRSRVLFIALLTLVIATLAGFYLIPGSETNPYFAWVNDILGISPPIAAVDPNLLKSTEKVKVVDARVPENPYWNLPNQITVPEQSNRDWIAMEEKDFRDRMKHNFLYQRYKTIQEIRAFRLKGSEALLWQGLEEKKFWTRMSSLIGLAERGITFNLDSVEKALGDARPDLIYNYCQRFVAEPNPAVHFILRHMIRLVDARTRLTILRALSKDVNPMNQLYLASASYDPVDAVKYFAAQELVRQKVNDTSLLSYGNFVTGVGQLPPDFFVDKLLTEPSQEAPANKEQVAYISGIRFAEEPVDAILMEQDIDNGIKAINEEKFDTEKNVIEVE